MKFSVFAMDSGRLFIIGYVSSLRTLTLPTVASAWRNVDVVELLPLRITPIWPKPVEPAGMPAGEKKLTFHFAAASLINHDQFKPRSLLVLEVRSTICIRIRTWRPTDLFSALISSSTCSCTSRVSVTVTTPEAEIDNLPIPPGVSALSIAVLSVLTTSTFAAILADTSADEDTLPAWVTLPPWPLLPPLLLPVEAVLAMVLVTSLVSVMVAIW